MWLSLFLLAFFGAVAYFQTIQGITSSAIHCVITVISLAIAFATYEWLAETALMGLKPEYAYAVALVVTFAAPVGVLRLLLDKYVPRWSHLPTLLDRAVAGAAGVCSAFLMTGVLALAIQMVPWGEGFLGYSRFNREAPDEQNELWLRPDRVTARFAASLSGGVFSGTTNFRDDHPDFVTELGWIQSCRGGMRRTVPADAIRVRGGSRLENLYDLQYTSDDKAEVEPVPPKAGRHYARLTLELGADTADPDSKKRFTPASVWLVGTTADEPAAYSAVAIANPDDPSRYVRSWTEARGKKEKHFVAGEVFEVPSNNQIEVAFDLPDDFVPRFVAFRRGGRAPVSKADFNRRQEPVEAASAPAPAPTPEATEASSSSSGGRVSGVKIVFGGSHFGADLPVTMTAYSGSADVQNGAMAEGNIKGNVADQGQVKSSQSISRFVVPSDKALLHLNVESLKAGSLYGKALNFAVQTVENYILEDDRGNKLTPVGKYAIATVGGTEIIEIQYASGIGGRVQPFSSIKSAHLQKDYQLVYLYLMDHGAKAVHFTPSGGKRSTDLRGENLVAP